MRASIDLNADLGEGAGQDEELLSIVSSASISCGAHAGLEAEIRATLRLAAARGVAVGAHPGFPDRVGYGRREMQLTTAELSHCIATQLSDFARWAGEAGARIRHVKPHGALYNMAVRDPDLANGFVMCVRKFDSSLQLFAPAASELARAAHRAGLRVVSEFFADRNYGADGRLVPRTAGLAMVLDPEVAAERVLHALRQGEVISTTGTTLPIEMETVCLHGDTPQALEFARSLKSKLQSAGVRITAPSGSGAMEPDGCQSPIPGCQPL